MKVVVFGATGRTGRLLVEGALARGHDVTAFVRAPNKLGALRDRVRVVHGDVLDGGAVSDAVDGQEAVLVALAGGGTKAAEQVNAQGTLNVIRSMQRYGVRRLVVLSAGGTQPGRDPNLPWFFERIVKPLFLKNVLADLRRMEISVRQSELDWTLVRAAQLVDGPARGAYRAEPGYSLPGGTKIARADVAAFMLDELERRDNIAHALAIAY
jgi:putative NADH-flavin reductase